MIITEDSMKQPNSRKLYIKGEEPLEIKNPKAKSKLTKKQRTELFEGIIKQENLGNLIKKYGSKEIHILFWEMVGEFTKQVKEQE